MHKTWPLGTIPEHFRRPEIKQLKEAGYRFSDPYEIVDIFEKKVSAFAGSKYAVAIDCCSHGLFLALKYLKAEGTITIPSHTYVSVPMQIRHSGCNVTFEELEWSGVYQLKPYPVWDAATRWQKDMYTGGMQVLSFQIKKRIPIGRGGMILTDDEEAYNWLKKARHDGRDMNTYYMDDDFAFDGWHYYMTPEDAARGILLMDQIPEHCNDSHTWKNYVDLTTKSIFTNN
jgi:dTDP-4-amino-4,6-dideoxygalactose transaminase